jgi:hypothetical protein
MEFKKEDCSNIKVIFISFFKTLIFFSMTFFTPEFMKIRCFVPLLKASLPLSFSFTLSYPASSRGCVYASAPTRVRADSRTPASVRADPRTHPRLCLYNPRPHTLFLLFLSFAFGWSCGICLATPISTCKGRRGHKHFEGDPLAFFAKQKFKGCIYPLDACVFSYASVYVKIFKRRRRRN